MGLFDGLGSAIGSLFTPPGTNARNAQEEGQQGVANSANKWLPDFSNLVGSQAKFASMLEPIRQHLLTHFFSQYDPSNTTGQLDQYQNQARDSFANSARDSGIALQGLGYGSGAVQGATQDAANQTAMATNKYSAYLNSPEYQAQSLQSILPLLTSSQSSPGLQGLSQLASIIYGQPQVQVGQGLASFLAPALGAYAGTL